MDKVGAKLLTDEMLRTCRKLQPVTRLMNESDDAVILHCFNKYLETFKYTGELLQRPVQHK
jgi:hypothetical protein